ncbi:manganese efflux pump MntP family protein [Neisseria sp. CCUG12390]|uniref:manganese efflux pump MntP n=1 Tax=Neisseria sp. CCUG12390 TaxID=3392035 RepID=UPI003A0FD765
MSLYALMVLELAMSMDAFAAAVVRGAACNRPRGWAVLKTALVFGLIETLMPLLGWSLGHMAQQFVREWDHWAAFVLLSFLGGKMIAGSFGEDEEDAEPAGNNWWMTVATAFATSIDSMIVGAGLAFLDMNIVAAALSIGLATTVMAAVGLGLGGRLGARIGKRAELFGGCVLIAIGVWILCDHLGLLA